MKKNKYDNKRHYSGTTFKIFTTTMFILLTIYALTILILLYFGLLTSLKGNVDFRYSNGGQGNILGFPNLSIKGAKDYLLLKNYGDIIKGFSTPYSTPAYFMGNRLINSRPLEVNFAVMLFNSLMYVVGGAFFMTIGKMIMGYMCAMYKNPVSKFIYGLVIVTMIIPIVGTTPAMLTLMRNVGLYDTFIGNYIQKYSFDGMYFLIFFEFFSSIPSAYKEAAEIDGASQLRIMLLIYFPLAVKMFSTVFLIRAIELWNDYNTVLLYLPSHPTLTYGVFLATFGHDQDRYPYTRRIAATMLLAVPTMIIFFIFKDRIMGNLSMGGLKE